MPPPSLSPKYTHFHNERTGEHEKVRLRDKNEIFGEAEAWIEGNRERLIAEHGKGYLYFEVDTLLHLVGVSFDSCARGWEVLMGPTPQEGWNIICVKL